MGLVNTPTWLLSVMGKSGLFQPWAIKLAEVIAWFQTGHGERRLHLLARGPARRAEAARAPALEPRRRHAQHRDVPPRRVERTARTSARTRRASRFDSTFSGDPDDPDRWQIRTGDAVIARYTTDQLRLLVHWDAELYTDLADLKKHVDHLDDLTPDRVFETFVRRPASEGRELRAAVRSDARSRASSRSSRRPTTSVPAPTPPKRRWPPMPPSTSVAFTKLIVHDLEKMAAFYREVYGLHAVQRVRGESIGRGGDRRDHGVAPTRKRRGARWCS